MELHRLKSAGAVFTESMSSVPDLIKRFDITGTPTLVDSPYGKAISFDGSTIVSYPHNTNLNFSNTSKMTIVMRFNSSVLSGSRGLIGKNYVNNGGWGFYTLGNEIRLDQKSTGGTLYTVDSSGAGLQENTWYDLVITQDGTAIKIYINNSIVLSATSTVNIGTTDNTKPLAIGALTPTTFEMTGKIKEVDIFDRIFSTQEISNFYNNTVFDYEKNVISEWDMSEINPQDLGFRELNNNLTGVNLDSTNLVPGFPNGTAINLNGIDEHITFSTNNVFTNNLIGTVFFVAKRSSHDVNYETLFKYGDTNSPYGGVSIFSMANGKLGFLWSSPYPNDEYSDSAINNDQWYIIALTSNGTNFYGYIDGDKQSFTGTVASYVTNFFFIGWDDNAATERWDGDVSKAIIIDKFMTEIEIKDLSNQILGGRR